MFCHVCGARLQEGASYCPSCGQPVGSAPLMPPQHGRIVGHVRLLGILWLAMSAFNAIGGLVLLIVGNAVFAHLNEMGVPPQVPRGFLTALVTTLGIIILAKATLGFLAGWGLMQRESWGRILGLVLAFISLFNIPFGTAIGVYTLWVLLPGPSQKEYDAIIAARAA